MTHKESFCWISVIRLLDFVAKAEFDWAVKTASQKKGIDCSRAEFLTIDEGLCVQIMHNGSYDDEPASVELMNSFIAENGCENDFSDTDKIDTFGGILKNRLHHEIYLSDPRKCAVEKLKTVIRHPVKKS